MQDFANKKVLLGICGGIAAYKSAFLVRELTRLGADVQVVMTESAQAFITPMTLQALSGKEVRTSLLDPQAERAMGHIELARWADYVLIAPATANCIAKLAHGLADDLLSTLYLVTEAQVILCPAMNRSMWAHPATHANIQTLLDRDVIIVGPEEGSQACGEEGYGRMSEVDAIIDACRTLDTYQLLAGKEVMITAGPTQESLDPVRYLSNRSSGKMGYGLAKAAQMAGAKVTLISGPTALPSPQGVSVVRVETADEMFKAVESHLKKGCIFIGTAAVSDYRVEQAQSQKIKKSNDKSLQLTLTENPDILAFVAASEKPAFVVGFAAETNDVIKHAKAKLKNKKLDMIIANQVGDGQGFDNDHNQVTVITPTQQNALTSTHKTRLAAQIIEILSRTLQNSAQ